MTRHPRLAWASLVTFIALGFGCVAVVGQEPQKGDKPTTEPPAVPLKAGNVSDPNDLEAFFDGALNVQLETKHIAGAVVAVVVGDKVVFTKGYGYADVAERKKVDPEKTMFRIASISKLLTWTAVMQQVEEGKIDLNADVNKYMKDVQIPEKFDKPVTLKDILTHTPGFEDYVIGLFSRKDSDVKPLSDVLKSQMPARVRPSGEIASYSNHGTAMAGYAVACVSGMPWEDYIEQRILKPLGMDHTLVRQPAENKIPADMSKGYKWEGGQFVEKGFEYIPAAPAGCISTTAADAAKFMIAHLNDGQLGDGRILKPETAKLMREPLFRHHPKTRAMCYGFWEEVSHGQRIVGHGGDTLWFHSLMQLIPANKVGVFVSYNTNTSAGVREPLFDAFLKRYYPEPDSPRIKSGEGARERANRVAGEYGQTRYSHTSIAKLAALLGVFDVTANDDDTITISVGGQAGRYVEKEPFVYREIDGSGEVVFDEDKNGKVLHLFPADWAAVSAVRRNWYERSDVHWGVLAGSIAVFLSALLFWPVIAFSVRGLQSPKIKRTRFSGFLSVLGWILSGLSIAFAVALVWVLRDPNEIAFGISPLLDGLLNLPLACAVLTGLVILGCLIAWFAGYWRITGRLHYTLVALAGVGFMWFLYYWNLMPLERVGM